MTLEKLVLCSSLLAVSCVMPAVHADDSGEGAWAAAITTNGLTGRYALSSTDDLILGASYGHSKSTIGSSTDTQNGYGIVVGERHYLSRGDLSRFINTALAYSDTSSSASSDTKTTSVVVAYGLEKRIGESFSVEGAAGIQMARMYGSGFDDTRFYIPTVEVGVDYYFR